MPHIQFCSSLLEFELRIHRKFRKGWQIFENKFRVTPFFSSGGFDITTTDFLLGVIAKAAMKLFETLLRME